MTAVVWDDTDKVDVSRDDLEKVKDFKQVANIRYKSSKNKNQCCSIIIKISS